MSRHRNPQADYHPAPPRGFPPRAMRRSTYASSYRTELRTAARRRRAHPRGTRTGGRRNRRVELGWSVRSRIEASSGRALRQRVIPCWNMGMTAELDSVWSKWIMRPTLVRPWRPGPGPGEEDCLEPGRGSRPRRAASAARAVTSQRQRTPSPDLTPPDPLARPDRGPSPLPVLTLRAADGFPPTLRNVTGAAATMKQTGAGRKSWLRSQTVGMEGP